MVRFAGARFPVGQHLIKRVQFIAGVYPVHYNCIQWSRNRPRCARLAGAAARALLIVLVARRPEIISWRLPLVCCLFCALNVSYAVVLL